MKHQKLFIIGLDCLTPQLVFDRWDNELPTFKKLRNCGIWGKMKSTIPCITVPAWASMVTGKDPGELGFYGFRNRKDYSYDNLYFANSLSVKYPAIWNILSRNKKTSILFNVPQTYPVKPLRGIMVSSFLAPDEQSNYTYPPEIKDEINQIVDDYQIDVRDFRTDNKQWLVEQINNVTDKHFTVVKNWTKNKKWDFFMFVEMGPDRLHHGFWGMCEPEHPKFNPDSRYVNTIKDYYLKLDKHIEDLLLLLDSDTTVIVVSDHGAKSMIGGFCINEWLIKEGLLSLKNYPNQPSKLSMDNVDWKNSYCWGDGGYYARIFFNIKGREPSGIINPAEYKTFRDNMINKIESIPDINGNISQTKAFIPVEIYHKTNGIPPDLIVYLDNLNLRSIGSIGHNDIYTFENDTGPDDANHDQYGIFIMTDLKDYYASKNINIERNDISIYDIAPTALDLMDVNFEKYNIRGKIIK
jgi:predicted AlkP superfamily phosphohydrolase/phosphomutase